MSGETGQGDFLFWLLVALMAGGAVILLLTTRTWLSPEEGEGERERGRGDCDLAVYRDQLSELEADVARGLLTEDQAESTRLEVGRRLLAADRERSQASKPGVLSPGLRRRSLIALIVFIPSVALGLYLLLGSPGLPGQPFNTRSELRQETETEAPDISAADIVLIVEKLTRELKKSPENLEGWKILAKSYLALDRSVEAHATLQEGMKHFPNDPVLILTLARLEVVLALEEEGTQAVEHTDSPFTNVGPVIPPEAAHLFERLLSVMPDHNEALWFVGLAEVQAGNHARAVDLWRRLLALIPKESENRAELEAHLQALEKTP